MDDRMLTETQSLIIDAIRLSRDHAPCGICYVKGKGWAVFDLRKGCGEHDPEFVALKIGTVPIPLTETAMSVLTSMVNALTG